MRVNSGCSLLVSRREGVELFAVTLKPGSVEVPVKFQLSPGLGSRATHGSQDSSVLIMTVTMENRARPLRKIIRCHQQKRFALNMTPSRLQRKRQNILFLK